ncbi:hypothetical protein Rsub_01240 [Raphidocelis subcapitata]|uniref:Cilia- and flagella-associated protein 251 n=1 Tax=Raphidocelis subcapitata TaxID=307507 RepID=A0A2V0NUM4_9CHLO|nr:hypothetical protein Rsub_01240 [Raphidocelis subcapitata]|eukprot:GBF88525.1 hypothetical protein Rsub_01240 [Raphidocelis subcapitata]
MEALVLGHVFGMSPGAGAVSLAGRGGEPCAAYAAEHTIVVHDAAARRQAFLQGHRNAVTCLEAPPDRSFLVSADAGPGSLLVAWDPASAQPLWSVRAPHEGGVAAMALSGDGRLLATLSAPQLAGSDGGATAQQELTIWQLPDAGRPLQQAGGEGGDEPCAQRVASSPVPGHEPQRCVRFNPEDATELVTNGARRVYFWRAPRDGQAEAAAPAGRGGGGGGGEGPPLLSYYSPPLVATDFRQAVGDFLASVFVPGSTQALTSTADGDVVVWDEQGQAAPIGTRASDRRAVKIMRLHEKGIPFLGSIGGFVVTGGADGLVRFYDGLLRLCAWFEELRAGPIVGASFSTAGEAAPQASTKLNRFHSPDFVVATAHGKLVAVSAATFDGPDVPASMLLLPGGGHSTLAASTADTDDGGGGPSGSGRSALAGQLLVQTACPDAVDIAAHPSRPEAFVLGASGVLQRWDLGNNLETAGSASCAASRHLPAECRGACALAAARDASFVAVGFEGGHVAVLEGESLEEVAVMRNTSQPIQRLAASSNGQLIAAVDAGRGVQLMALLPRRGTSLLAWEFVGKARAHEGPIVALVFGESPAGQTRLFSLGGDGRLAEWQLASLAPGGGLRLVGLHDVAPPGAGMSTAMCFAPPMPYWARSSTETLLLIADDGYKVRAYNPDSRTARATFLGPTHGGPIARLLPFRSVASGGSWLAYATADQVVGLIAWPLVGDPELSMGVIAHPGRVAAVAVSFNGRKLLTAGEGGVVNAWSVDTSSLEAHATALASAAARASAAIADAAGAGGDGSGCAAATAAHLAGADTAATGADMARWEALVGDAALVDELRDLFTLVELREAEARAAAAAEAEEGPLGGAPPGTLPALTGHVPASALPELMRAAGFYPSGAEVEALVAHVRFLAGLVAEERPPAAAAAPGAPAATAGPAPAAGSAAAAAEAVDFGTFLALLVNHRPVRDDVTQEKINAAFAALAAAAGGGAGGALEGRVLLDALQRGGDAVGAAELQRILEVLTGGAALPETVTPLSFTADVLGLGSGADAAGAGAGAGAWV